MLATAIRISALSQKKEKKKWQICHKVLKGYPRGAQA